MAMRFGIGVLGATGYIATPYRQEIRDSAGDAKIVALCARRRELLDAAGREDGAELVTADWRAVVEHPAVNTVLVATPDALHHEAVMACAVLGKHVICEKPVATDAGQARQMRDACRQAGVGTFVPFWTRYVRVFGRARELIRSGALGEVRVAIYRWHNPRPAAMPFTWRDDAALSSAGSVADVGSHAYDTLRWLLGIEAVRVLAHAEVIAPAKPDLGAVNLDEALRWGQAHRADESPRTRRGTAFDYAAIAWELAGGVVGALVLSHAPFLRKGLAPEVELHGTDASLAVDRGAGTLTLAAQGEPPRVVERVADPGFGNRFARHVFPALRAAAGQPSEHPSLEDGYRVQLFTDAAAQSARHGKWVALADV
jgi:predicted dehydrogenase